MEVMEIVRRIREEENISEAVYKILETVFDVRSITMKCERCGLETDIFYIKFLKLKNEEKGKFTCTNCYFEILTESIDIDSEILISPPYYFAPPEERIEFIDLLKSVRGINFHSSKYTNEEIKQKIAKVLTILKLMS